MANTSESKGTIREMTDADLSSVLRIYKFSVDNGQATFNSECPSFEEWNSEHIKECRYVYVINDQVVGWVALSPTSSRNCFRGVVEISLYIDDNFRGRGIGTALMKKELEESEKAGYWCIYSSIFTKNEASLALHKKCGFRTVGIREKIAKDRFGEWLDTTIMEYRNSIM